MNRQTLIQIENLEFKYPQSFEYTLKGISFYLNSGDILGIIGPNGGGKSTLLRIIAGLLKPSNGTITKTKNPSIIYLPQKDKKDSLIPFTLQEWLEISNLPQKKVSKDQIEQSLQKVSLEKKLSTNISELSGGEYQRLLLAKAWLSSAKIILLDEPTKGLDAEGQDRLLLLIKELRESKNVAIIMIDHNIQKVLKHCDRILCLNKTFHWHDNVNEFDKGILEETYHCEWEHILIHEKGGDILEHNHKQHAHCDGHHHKKIKQEKENK